MVEPTEGEVVAQAVAEIFCPVINDIVKAVVITGVVAITAITVIGVGSYFAFKKISA